MKMKDLAYIASGLLVLAVLPLFYTYYIFLRLTIFAISSYFLYSLYKQESEEWRFRLIAFAFLFNPILPFFLSKFTWVLIDLYGAYFFFQIAKSSIIDKQANNAKPKLKNKKS